MADAETHIWVGEMATVKGGASWLVLIMKTEQGTRIEEWIGLRHAQRLRDQIVKAVARMENAPETLPTSTDS